MCVPDVLSEIVLRFEMDFYCRLIRLGLQRKITFLWHDLCREKINALQAFIYKACRASEKSCV